MRRTQIYLDEEQDRRLAERARATGRTKVRPDPGGGRPPARHAPGEEEELARFRPAVDAAFGIAPYLEDGATYVRKLRDIDRRREERREREWHG